MGGEAKISSFKNNQQNNYFNLSPNALCLIDNNTSIKVINPAFIELTGYTLHELKSKEINSIIHPDDLMKSLNKISILMNGEDLDSDLLIRIIHKDSTDILTKWELSRILDIYFINITKID